MKKIQSFKSEIEQLIAPVLEKHALKVYEINNFHEFGSDVLQILVEDQTNPRKALDLDFLIQVNEEISAKLDEIEDQVSGNYVLEVASAGVERQLKTETEMINSVGEYVFVQLNQPTKQNLVEFNATIDSYDDQNQQFRLTYFVKGQKKKIELKFSEIKFIRYAVKF